MQENRSELTKNLSPVAIWSIALGTIIGFGAFVLPGEWLKLGGPGGILIGFTLGGLFMLVISRSYGFMVEKIPIAGGAAAYAYGVLGRPHAFIVGWGLVLAYGSIVPLNATALALVGKFVAPGLFSKVYLYNFAGWDIYLGEILLASALIIGFGILNYRGIKEVGNMQMAMIFLMVGTILIITAGALMYDGSTITNLKPFFAANKSIFASIGAVLAITPWAFCGFDTIPQSSEEFNFDHKETFRLLVFAILAGLLMYLAMCFSTAVVIPWQELINKDVPWYTGFTTETSLGMLGLICLVIAVTMGVGTGINGQLLSSTRILFSMGRAKILPEWFAKVNPKFGTPGNAIIFITVLSLFFPWIGRQVVLWIVNMAAVGNSLGYGYTCLAAWLLAKNYPHLTTKANKFWFFLGFAFSVILLILLIVPGMPAFLTPLEFTLLGFWILMGAVLYIYQSKRVNLTKDEQDQLMLGDIRIENLK
ncbi:Amino acid transporter [Desulfonispora thiosulfatigenes DSM 11270]|uniref:Amino acid transporter n=1 Tax=Desulfonispora thiosulfatigenes DSM 11270 TaxID=656914 RepID=A0A1W1VK73_DESTI|nr:APC family permease [Desulfonispora thiosulfatigenes]SMB93762.1 Amino acid transporter [Desulfonispora thiosulfatigenes DSM 11270]